MYSKLTIIIAFYNAIKHKDILLANIRRNQAVNINFIIIDDGSNDGLLSLAEKEITKNTIAPPANIIFIKNPKNYGISKSRNIGIEKCKTDFLLFCDVDDSLDLSLITDLNKILNKKFDLQIFNHQFFTNKFNLIQDSINHGYTGVLRSENIPKLVINYLESPVGRSILVQCWGCIFKRQFLIENEINFDDSLDKYEDSLFISKVITTSKCIYISNINIYKHWIHHTGLSYKSYKSEGKFSKHIEVYYEYLSNIKIKNSIELKHSAISYYLSKTLIQIQNKGLVNNFASISKILSEEAILESLKFNKIQCIKMPFIKNWMFKSRLIIIFVLTLYNLRNKMVFFKSAKFQ
jgi:glycosyltransferase involved in cell wall biosynthesis